MTKIKSNIEIAQEVLHGKWGNGQQRKNNLISAGYDYEAIQYLVNNNLCKNIVPNENAEKTQRLLNVEVDLTKYDGVTLIIVGANNA